MGGIKLERARTTSQKDGERGTDMEVGRDAVKKKMQVGRERPGGGGGCNSQAPEGENRHIQSLLKEGTISRNVGKVEGSP